MNVAAMLQHALPPLLEVLPSNTECDAIPAATLFPTTIINEHNEHEQAIQEVNLHDIWEHNLEEEFEKLREIIYDYPFVAMDTEFPGVVMNPEGNFISKADFNYKQVHCNVNKLKLIQVGLVLMDERGNLPPGNDIWQFNFKFNLSSDQFNVDSIEVLKTAGLDFDRHKQEGIQMEDFGEQLTISGLICDEQITWITFHSGYDFGYLMKTITNGPLPNDETTFFKLFKSYFPKSYDAKLLIRHPLTINILKGGLQECADQLHVMRFGRSHQAGSDALLTAQLFFKIKETFFSENWDEILTKFQGEMYGLGSTLSLWKF